MSKTEEIVKSDSTGKFYYPSECIRIVNPRQTAMYLTYGHYPVDFYASKDFKTGEPILVFIFNKKDTRKVYEKWMDYKLG